MTEFIDEDSSGSDWSSSSSSSDSASLNSFLREELTYNENMSKNDSYLQYYRERMALKRKKKSNRFVFKPRRHQPFRFPIKKDGTPAPGACTFQTFNAKRSKAASAALARNEKDCSKSENQGKPMQPNKSCAAQEALPTQRPVPECNKSSTSVGLPKGGLPSPVFNSSIRRNGNGNSRKGEMKKSSTCHECNRLICECH